MMSNRKILSGLVAIAITITSCVPSRLYEESKTKAANCETELAKQKSDSREAIDKYMDVVADYEGLKKRITALQRDTTIQGKSLAMITHNYDKLNETYNLLLEKNKELTDLDRADNKRLVGDLQLTQEQLQRKEDRLRKLEDDLETKKANLDKLKEELDKSKEALDKTTADLRLRESKVAELQAILNSKDSAVASLKKKVSDALIGFENNGLTIQQKNGKVYVSLEERLLFASGSINVDVKGVDALKKLAKVLEQNTDINVLIEGHTDNVPYNGVGGAIKDNWDLSVLRATSIVKIISSSNKIEPKRLTAAGRGEYAPIDVANNAEARKKNRRTEIILTPKLDELFKVLNSN